MTDVVAVRFKYDGASRIVDNVAWEDWHNTKTLVGFEVRKSGRFSYKIKRYTVDKVSELVFIDPPKRSGPVIGR